MDDDDNGPDLFISFSIDISLMRFIGNTLIPSLLSLNVAIERGEDADDNAIELALTKWRYYLDNIISKGIAFSKDNSQAMDILIDENGTSRTSNLFILTPQEPSDEMLGSLFQAKFNALGEGNLIASSVEIASDNLHGLSFTLIGDHSTFLPTTVEEYLGGPSFWEKPWWMRDDASSIDVLKMSEDAPSPSWAYSLDFLDRTAKTKSILTRPVFRPTVIDGGKPDPK